MLEKDAVRIEAKVDDKSKKGAPKKEVPKGGKGASADGYTWGEVNLKTGHWEVTPCRGSIQPNATATVAVN